MNTQYTQVLMELNENGVMDAAYTYGTARLTEDRFTGEINFYLYDPLGNVAGITDQDGYLWQSYRYDAFGNATFGSPQYDNEYTFNGESYNPNIHSQYLRARYYDTVKGCFLTEDSYLVDISNPLTLNRYSYCIGNPLFYSDPSGHMPTEAVVLYENETVQMLMDNLVNNTSQEHKSRVNEAMDHIYDWLGEEDRSSAKQFVDGFLTGFAGSFYATYDAITNPEYLAAIAFDMLNHPVRTLAAIAKSAVAGDTMELLHYIDTKNYRALGQNMGYRAGKLAQIALARAAIKKCGELLNKKGGETPPLKNEGGSAVKGTLTGKLDGLTAAEKTTVDDLLNAGKDVEIIPRSNIPGQKTPDFLVNGVKTELKTLTGTSLNTPVTRIQDGFKQGAEAVIIDGRNTGLTIDNANTVIERVVGKYGGELPGTVEIWTIEGIIRR
ncbi:MAG: hypothetical protein K2P14_08690 [Anaeroplasmataceae bacterium]|nr:hypothetical protein [Anaeroplasmataceae bacterium]